MDIQVGSMGLENIIPKYSMYEIFNSTRFTINLRQMWVNIIYITHGADGIYIYIYEYTYMMIELP